MLFMKFAFFIFNCVCLKDTIKHFFKIFIINKIDLIERIQFHLIIILINTYITLLR